MTQRITPEQVAKLKGLMTNPSLPHSRYSVIRRGVDQSGHQVEVSFEIVEDSENPLAALPFRREGKGFCFACQKQVSVIIDENVPDQIIVPLPYEAFYSPEQAVNQFAI